MGCQTAAKWEGQSYSPSANIPLDLIKFQKKKKKKKPTQSDQQVFKQEMTKMFYW